MVYSSHAPAKSETDRAICYSPALAAMDLQLAEIYREKMQPLSLNDRRVVQAQQQAWLVEHQKQWFRVEVLSDDSRSSEGPRR